MSFYFPYCGSKRLDMKFFKDFIDLKNIKIIVEPFCGSSAFSFYCKKVLNYNEKFHINDIDKEHIDFLKSVVAKKGIKYYCDIVNNLTPLTTKEEYIIRCKNVDYGYFYKNKIYAYRKGLPPLIGSTKNKMILEKYKDNK